MREKKECRKRIEKKYKTLIINTNFDISQKQKKPTTSVILQQKDKKMETANPQNSTVRLAQSNTRPKFAKSCFFVDAPLDSETFDVSCRDFLIN